MDVNDLETLTNPAAEPAPEPLFDPPPADPTTAPEPAAAAEGEEAPDAEPAEEAQPDGAEEAPPEEEPEPQAPAVAADTEIIKLDDGEEITVADMRERWRKSGMMQSDYTRKTQAHAKEVEAFEGTKAELGAWLQNMHEPDLLEAQCLELFPDAFERVVERRAKELLALTDKSADPRAVDLVQRERRLRIEQAAIKSQAALGKAVNEVETKRREKIESAQRVTELRETFAKWNGDAMAAAGLDTKNGDHAQLVVGMIKASVPPGVELTAEHFREAAKRVAKAVGTKPAAVKQPVQRKAAPLPPSTGGKATARTTAPQARGAGGNGSTRPKRSMSDFMNDVMAGKI